MKHNTEMNSRAIKEQSRALLCGTIFSLHYSTGAFPQNACVTAAGAGQHEKICSVIQFALDSQCGVWLLLMS